MARIQISNDPSGLIIVSFPYDPLLVEKVKTVDGRRWHPTGKHWSFRKLDGLLEKILKVFENENIQIDPALKTAASKVKPAPIPDPLRRESPGVRCGVRDTPSPLAGEGWGEGYNLEDLRRELIS